MIRTTLAASPPHSRSLLVFITPPPDGSLIECPELRRRAPLRHQGLVTDGLPRNPASDLWRTTQSGSCGIWHQRCLTQRRPRAQRALDGNAPPGSGTLRVPDPTSSLPALGPSHRARAPDADAGVDGDAAVGEREHGVQIELGDCGQILTEPREAQDEVDERGAIGRRGAAEAGDEAARLAAVDELLGVDVRQRRDPERRLA